MPVADRQAWSIPGDAFRAFTTHAFGHLPIAHPEAQRQTNLVADWPDDVLGEFLRRKDKVNAELTPAPAQRGQCLAHCAFGPTQCCEH